jgi:hypothetical protein
MAHRLRLHLVTLTQSHLRVLAKVAVLFEIVGHATA